MLFGTAVWHLREQTPRLILASLCSYGVAHNAVTMSSRHGILWHADCCDLHDGLRGKMETVVMAISSTLWSFRTWRRWQTRVVLVLAQPRRTNIHVCICSIGCLRQVTIYGIYYVNV